MAINPVEKFLTPWIDKNKFFISIEALLMLIAFLALTWVITNVPEQAGNATIFLWLLMGTIIAGVADIINEKNFLIDYLNWGNSELKFVLSFFVGIVLSVIIISFTNIDFSLVAFSITTASLATFFYIVIVAPFVEEQAFRGFIFPTSAGLFKNIKLPFPNLLGAVFSSLAFGIFHWFAFGGLIIAIFAGFLFGMISIIGNAFFQSRGFSLGFHIANNFLILLITGVI